MEDRVVDIDLRGTFDMKSSAASPLRKRNTCSAK